METRSRNCPVCTSDKFKSLDFLVNDEKSAEPRQGSHIDAKFYPLLKLSLCLRCSQVFYSTIPSDIDSIYKENYRAEGEFNLPGKLVNNHKKCVLWHSLLAEYLKPNSSFLDVGCAEGFFVDFLCKRDIKAEGLEINKLSVRHGREVLGRTIYDFDVLKLTDKKYDVIFNSGYLEHIEDPMKILNHFKTLLNPGGIVYIQTPDVFSPNKPYLSQFFPAEHFQTFSTETLSYLLQDCGFEIIKTRTDVLNNGLAIIAQLSAENEPNTFIGHPSAFAAENKLLEIYQEFQKLNGGKSFRPCTPYLSQIWLHSNTIPMPAALGKAAKFELAASMLMGLDMDLIWTLYDHIGRFLDEKGYL